MGIHQQTYFFFSFLRLQYFLFFTYCICDEKVKIKKLNMDFEKSINSFETIHNKLSGFL